MTGNGRSLAGGSITFHGKGCTFESLETNIANDLGTNPISSKMQCSRVNTVDNLE